MPTLLFVMTLSLTSMNEPFVLFWKSMALVVNLLIEQRTTVRDLPARNRIPLGLVPRPSMSRPSRMTLSVAGAETTMALVPETSTPASNVERIVIAFVIVTPPKPPGSRTLISPPVAVLEIAPAKVLQGAVRLQGFASSPTPDTQVRDAWAFIITDASKKIPRTVSFLIGFLLLLM